MKFSDRLFSNAALSVMQTVVSAVLLFFLYRYLLHNLGAEQLGIWSVVLASTSVGRLSDLGFSGAVLKFVARHFACGDQQKASSVVQTAALSIGLVLAILAAATYPVLIHILTWSLPAKSLSLALAILPWAVLSLWFGMVGGIFQSALDGCQRMDIRNLLLLAGNILYIGGVFWLVPHFGLEGLAKGQLVQSIALLVISWLMLRRQLTALPWLPQHWSKATFKEIFGYALNFQISSIAGLFFDPITKFLMSRYGGLTNTAYYEMASQVMIKARGLLVSALQAVVPVIAATKESDTARLIQIYQKSYKILFFLAWPYYFAFAMAFPLISSIWIGRIEINFIIFGQILSAGWLLNTLALPAWLHNLGTGNLSWNTATQVGTGLLNLMFGWLLGQQFGGVGIVTAAMIAVALASWILIIAVQQKLEINIKDITPIEHRMMSLWATLGAIAGYTVYSQAKTHTSDLVSSLASLSIFLGVMVFVMWFHPYRGKLQKSFSFKSWHKKKSTRQFN